MTEDEAADVAWTMDFAQRAKDYRSLSACLELLTPERLTMADFINNVAQYEETLYQIAKATDLRQMASNRKNADQILSIFEEYRQREVESSQSEISEHRE